MGNHPSKSSPPSAEPASGKTASLSSTTPDSFSKGSQRWKNRLSAGVKDGLGKVDIKRLSRKPSASKGATSGAASSVGGKEDEGLAKKGAEELPVQESGPALAANTALAPVPPSSTSTSAATATATPIVIVTEAQKPAPQPQPQQIQLKIPTPPMAPSTVPCQYRTGKTLGSGTYAIVKEAIQIKTGKYYACKVISKKLMEGREYMVRNEIAVLKRVSVGHRNIVTLHDYFETTHNLYLVFDLCTGGELFDRICAKGNYFEGDAAGLVRTVLGAVEYIHSCGIVHRDLKPENLLFREKSEEADIMIADFGLSRVMEEEKLQMLTEICGTPGYMAPEIFKKTGHGKPVDIWAIGVITYFLLCGYTPFDRDTQEQETQAICKGDYKFEPEEYWENVSQTARDFVSECLTIDPASRPTATEALKHEWLATDKPCFIADGSGNPKNLLPSIQKGFNARKTFRKAVLSMMAVRKMSMLSTGTKLSPSAQELASNIGQYLQDSEKEQVDGNNSVWHLDNTGDSNKEAELKRTDDISVSQNGNGKGSASSNKAALLSPTDVNSPPVEQLKESSLEAKPESTN